MRTGVIFAILLGGALLTGCKDSCDYGVNKPVGRGCKNFVVFDEIKVDGYRHSYLFIDIKRELLDLGYDFRSFDVTATPAITGGIESFSAAYPPYCTDAIAIDVNLLNSWELSSGTVGIRVVDNENECGTYLAEVILSEVEFMDSTGSTINIKSKYFERVVVGLTIP